MTSKKLKSIDSSDLLSLLLDAYVGKILPHLENLEEGEEHTSSVKSHYMEGKDVDDAFSDIPENIDLTKRSSLLVGMPQSVEDNPSFSEVVGQACKKIEEKGGKADSQSIPYFSVLSFVESDFGVTPSLTVRIRMCGKISRVSFPLIGDPNNIPDSFYQNGTTLVNHLFSRLDWDFQLDTDLDYSFFKESFQVVNTKGTLPKTTVDYGEKEEGYAKLGLVKMIALLSYVCIFGNDLDVNVPKLLYKINESLAKRLMAVLETMYVLSNCMSLVAELNEKELEKLETGELSEFRVILCNF